MKPVPRLSVGLPVYNGENFLEQSLDSLLAQSFGDFELVISDNASTDATADICHAYAAGDSRIRYFRQPVNIGGSPNQDAVFRASRGELFKWAAHDDLYGRDLLARCVEVLDARPEIVLAHADMALIDAAGEVIHDYDYVQETGSPDVTTRFRSLLVTDGGDDEYGVMRSDVLRKVKPCGSYHNAGRPFVAEIAMHGPFHQVRERLFYRRDHPARGDRNPTIRSISRNLDPRRAGQTTARLVAEYVGGYISAIHRSPVTPGQRRTCYRHLAGYLATRTVSGPAQIIGRSRRSGAIASGQGAPT